MHAFTDGDDDDNCALSAETAIVNPRANTPSITYRPDIRDKPGKAVPSVLTKF